MQNNDNNRKNDRLLRIMVAYKGVAEERKKAREEEEAKHKHALTSHLTEVDGTEVPISESMLSHFESEDEGVESDSLGAHFSGGDDIKTKPAKTVKKRRSNAAKAAASAGRGVFRAGSLIAKIVMYVLVVLVIAAYCSYYAISIANDVFALVKEDVSYTLTVDENTTINSIAHELEQNGIIKYSDMFRLYLLTQREEDEEGVKSEENMFYPGEHTVSAKMNYSQLYTVLATKNVVREVVRVTIPEGVTTDQLIDILVENGIGEKENYVEAINLYPYKHEFVQLLDETGWSDKRTYRLDGYLFPDTYEFYTDYPEYLVINRLLNTFENRFWKDYKKTYKDYLESINSPFTFDDIITLAAMVEREGGVAQEYEYISYVFQNRLSHKDEFPRLESDATINYILSLSGEHHADLTVEDLAIDSPYNTYIAEGLPPGAICNPGLDALVATVFPIKPVDANGSDINAYYFVSSKQGNTYYARTLAGHKENIAKVKKENEEYDAEHNSEH